MYQIALIHALRNTKAGKTLLGVMRVSGYLIVVGTLGSVVAVHQAKAAIGENSLALAHDLLPMADLLKDGHTLNLNGQRIHVASTVTPETTAQVLDRYEAACKDGDNNAAVWHGMSDPQNPAASTATRAISSIPIIRNQRGTEGVVTCFVRDTTSTKSLEDSVTEFLTTGEMGTLGKLRYVTVGSTTGGTGVITAWTDETFNINALAPADGVDAPGLDPVNLPRPAKAARILSGGLEGMPFGVYMYVSSATPAAEIADYDVQMAERKWTIVKSHQLEESAHEGTEAHAYLNTTTGVQVFVTCGKLDDGRTGIGISESHDFEDRTKLPNPGQKTAE